MAAFKSMHLDGVLRLCTAEGWPTFPADPQRALRALLAPGAATVVALDQADAVIGFAHALTDGVTAYLAELLVTPEHRSRGLGRQLIAEVLQQCRVARMDVITDTAEGFYETLPHRCYAGFRLYPQN
ncbi:MAG: GNAT family N-acetyltransferase [Pseudonocardiaceae bacterium]